MSIKQSKYVSVIGAAEASALEQQYAYELGKGLAENDFIMVCGGLGGVMESAARGVSAAGGTSVGILPDPDRSLANPYLTVSIPTNLSYGRNFLVVLSGEAVVAIGGGAGTLSEIGLAVKLARPIILLQSLDVEKIGLENAQLTVVQSPGAAVKKVRELLS